MRFVDTIYSAVQRSRSWVSGVANVREEDIKPPSDPTEADHSTENLVHVIRTMSRRVASVEAKIGGEPTEFEVNLPTNGGTVKLYHGYNCPVRFFVTHWTKQDGGIAPVHSYNKAVSVVDYGFTVGVWSVGAANISVGSSWRQKNRREIIGVRFTWTAGATTVRARLWNNTTGLSLASKDIAVTNTNGVYEAIFTSPVTADLTNTDITVSVWDTAAIVYTYNNDVRLVAPIEIGPDLRLINFLNTPAAGGDTRPATVAAGGHFMVEPILGNYSAAPELVIDTANTDSKTLVLKSYSTGKAVIRVEPAQAGVRN